MTAQSRWRSNQVVLPASVGRNCGGTRWRRALRSDAPQRGLTHTSSRRGLLRTELCGLGDYSTTRG